MQRKFKTRLAADIGGTFTDVAAFDQKTLKLLLGKTLSTPNKLVNGISEGVEKAKSCTRLVFELTT